MRGLEALRLLGRARLLLAIGLAGLASNLAVSAPQTAPAEYRKYFRVAQDKRSVVERALNIAGLSATNVGTSIAVIAGVSNYQHLGTLRPAAIDIDRLIEHLSRTQGFDQIVVLQDGAFAARNLDYFLTEYVPEELSKRPRSRFLFAFSGHGSADEDGVGYLLRADARTLKDQFRAIDMSSLKSQLLRSVRRAHQSLVLINSCYSGTFLVSSSGPEDAVVPLNPGAHAILASSKGELSWNLPEYGHGGSIFFEALFKGLASGAADLTSYSGVANRPDGIVTYSELATYLDAEIRNNTRQAQNPIAGPMIVNASNGGFFFIGPAPRAPAPVAVGPKPGGAATSFGSTGSAESTPPEPALSHTIPVNSRLTRFIAVNAPDFAPGGVLKIKISTNSSRVRAVGLFDIAPGKTVRVDAKFVTREGGNVILYRLPENIGKGEHQATVLVQELGTSGEERHKVHFNVR